MGALRFFGRLFRGSDWEVMEQAEAQPEAPLALPAQIMLGDASVELRYLTAEDGPAILAFARTLPPGDLLFLRRDITRPEQVDNWLHEASAGLATTILALQDGQIVGYATVAADGLTWTRHVRELRVLVAPRMRGHHLGRKLVEEAFAVARQQGARKMMAQMTVDQESAIAAFKRIGFQAEARLHGQVIDRKGELHDLQIMSLNVDEFEAKLELASSRPADFPL
jgi:L-amino acid N-acyltransferase YncA